MRDSDRRRTRVGVPAPNPGRGPLIRGRTGSGPQASFNPNVVDVCSRGGRHRWAATGRRRLEIDLKPKLLHVVLNKASGIEIDHNFMPGAIPPRATRISGNVVVEARRVGKELQ